MGGFCPNPKHQWEGQPFSMPANTQIAPQLESQSLKSLEIKQRRARRGMCDDARTVRDFSPSNSGRSSCMGTGKTVCREC